MGVSSLQLFKGRLNTFGQKEENLLYFRDQVANSHQIREMMWQTSHSNWKNESTDSAHERKDKTNSH